MRCDGGARRAPERALFPHTTPIPPTLGLVLAVAVGLATHVVPSSARAQAPPAGAPQIAILLPLSGPHEHIGSQLLESLTLALEDRPGATWTVVDSAGDPEVAARQARELAANPANLAIVGPVGALESRAAAAVAGELGVPLLALTSEEGVEDYGQSVLRARVSPEEQARYMAHIAHDELDLERVAVVYPEDAFGEAAARAFVEEVLRLGGRVTGLESYAVDETNVNDAIELLAAQRVRVLRGRAWREPPRVYARHRSSTSRVDFQALLLPDDDERIGELLAFFAFWDVPVGRSVQLLGLSSWAGPGLALAGELAQGALLSTIFNEGTYSVRGARFAERFREAHGRGPTEADAQAYDALSFLLDVLLTRTPPGGWTRAALRDTLSSAAPLDGLVGPIGFGADGAVQRRLELFSVGSGGWVGPYVILR